MNKDLETTLKAAKTQGIINKEQFNELNKYRDIFRNGFSHADTSKIFGERKIPLAYGSFDDPNNIITGEYKLSNIPMLHEVAIKQLVEKNSYPYFSNVFFILLKAEKNVDLSIKL